MSCLCYNFRCFSLDHVNIFIKSSLFVWIYIYTCIYLYVSCFFSTYLSLLTFKSFCLLTNIFNYIKSPRSFPHNIFFSFTQLTFY